MAKQLPDDVTSLLAQWQQGSAKAEARLLEIVQSELRQLARSALRRERREHTLQPTALVNEAYLRLVQQKGDWQNRSHFFGMAARIMRRILVDQARRRLAAKRAGFSGERITLSGIADAAGHEDVDVLSLHEALTRLAAMDPRQASLVELRYFGGLTIDEVSASATISPATVKRELRTATLWLRREMVDTKGRASSRPTP